jgi:hypothetical protein
VALLHHWAAVHVAVCFFSFVLQGGAPKQGRKTLFNQLEQAVHPALLAAWWSKVLVMGNSKKRKAAFSILQCGRARASLRYRSAVR